MPTTLPDLILRARLEMADNTKPFLGQYEGDGTTTVVLAPDAPLNNSAIVVTQGTTVLTLNSDYIVDIESGTVSLALPIPDQILMTIKGNAFRYFSDADWMTFFTSALDQHLLGRTDELGQAITLDTLPDVETYPIVLLGLTQALLALINDASFDIDIQTLEGVNIPRSQRVNQLWHVYTQRLDQYNKMCAALNVGMYRIESLQLRRVSRMTERLVPIYQAREFVDQRWPRQLFVPLNTDGMSPEDVVPLQQEIALVGYANHDFSYTLTLGVNLTGLQVAAGIRRYPGALTPMIFMTVEILDVPTGQIRLTVGGRLMYYAGNSKFWDVQTIDAVGNVTTLVGGTFDAIQQGNPAVNYLGPVA